MPDTTLKEREELILQAIVHLYITDAEPVGSRAVVKRFDLDISPATVRNVMADLEEAGYINQVHTSSGRVPTDKGYRYYVDYLMRVQKVTSTERTRIEENMAEQLNNADTILKQTSNLLAMISHQTGIVEVPNPHVALVNRIELMLMDDRQTAMLIADNFGRARTLVLPWTPSDDVELLIPLNNFLNEQLKGTSIESLSNSLRTTIQRYTNEQHRLAEHAKELLNHIPGAAPGKLYLKGATQLFEQPEFHDVDRAREVFGLLEENDRVVELMRNGIARNADASRVVIGSEDLEHGLEDVSVVSAAYKVNDEEVGMIGVLGPRRMPYSKLTGIVEYTADRLGAMLTRISR